MNLDGASLLLLLIIPPVLPLLPPLIFMPGLPLPRKEENYRWRENQPFVQGRRGQLPGLLTNFNIQPIIRSDRLNPVQAPSFTLLGGGICGGDSAQAGVCLAYPSCFIRGGSVGGTCGFLVCCKFSGSCGDTASTRVSHFADYNRRSSDPDCTYKIKPTNNDICQIRLDWEYLRLGSNTTHLTTSCNGLSSLMLPSSRPGHICGDNGQPGHVYVNVPKRGETVTIKITDALLSLWSIVVTQIECPGKMQAPRGCSQYHMKDNGTISSYLFTSIGVGSYEESGYNVCIKPKNSCGVRFHNAVLNMNNQTNAAPDDCRLPYLVIPGGVYTQMNSLYSGSIFCKNFAEVSSQIYQVIYSPNKTVTHQNFFKINYELITC